MVDRGWRSTRQSSSWRGGSWRGGKQRGHGGTSYRSGGRSFNDDRPKLGDPSQNSSSAEPLGPILQTIVPGQISVNARLKDEKPTIDKCEYVASYNWLDTKHATILVPGSPPTWLPLSRARKLKEDSGTYYRDQNAARYPPYPVEPAMRAVLNVRPDFDCLTVDVVGCGNTFGSLLSACRASDERTFAFGVERIGSTIFLVRQTAPGEVIENVRGYGHSFPEAYTTWPKQVKGSVSHQRLVKYQFGDFHCLIRSESDGYLPEKNSTDEVSDGVQVLEVKNTNLEDVAKKLKVSPTTQTRHSKLSVQQGGEMIPQSAIFDLKTRSVHRDVDVEEFLPRLWVNQTPNLIIAKHKSGIFADIEIHDVEHAVKQWESTNSDILLRLHNVLSKLIEITGKDGCSRIQVRRNGLGPLEIRNPVNKWTVLPSELKAKWTGETFNQAEEGMPEGSDSDDEENVDYLKF